MFDQKGRDSWQDLHDQAAGRTESAAVTRAQAAASAIRWARQILTTDLVVLDTETTGLDDTAEAVSLAIVSSTGKTLLDCLLRPRNPIPLAATAVHGISDDDVAGALDLAELVPALYTLLHDRHVLIYNADFDVRILRQSLKMRGVDGLIDPRRACCVMERFAEFYGEWDDYRGNYRWQKLTTAARYFGLDTAGAHGAAADCRLTLAVVRAMAESELSEDGPAVEP